MNAMAPALYQAWMSDAREDAALRERERWDAAAAEARRAEELQAQRSYYLQHGESEADSIRRQALMQALNEEAERQAEKERLAEKYANDLSRLQLEGYRPRSVAEVLATAAGMVWS